MHVASVIFSHLIPRCTNKEHQQSNFTWRGFPRLCILWGTKATTFSATKRRISGHKSKSCAFKSIQNTGCGKLWKLVAWVSWSSGTPLWKFCCGTAWNPHNLWLKIDRFCTGYWTYSGHQWGEQSTEEHRGADFYASRCVSIMYACIVSVNSN